MAFDVVVSGLNVVDLLVGLPAKVEQGKKYEVDNILIQGGAPAGNGACGMAGLGMKTAFLGFMGKNTQSEIAKTELERCGVDTSLMLTSDVDAVPAMALVEVDPNNGERTVFYTLNGYHALAPSDIQEEWVKKSKMVYVDGYDIDGNIALLELAKKHGVESVCDIEAGDIDKLKTMLKLGGHVILPLEGAQEISGKQDAEECLHALQQLTDAQLLVTDGANGSWALSDGYIIHQSCFKVDVVDTTECGDAYHAAYAYALQQGYSLAERMEFASAFAAIIAKYLGGRTYQPEPEEVHEFIKANKA